MARILVIEDEKDIRENILQILKLNDYDVISGENGNIGLILALENNPDLIICDIMMPEMDGYEFLGYLRNNSQTNTIPCIFVTAKVNKRDIRQGMALGADDYITKPFTPEELLEAVTSRLQRQEHIRNKIQFYAQEYQQVIAEIKQINQEQEKELKNNQHLIKLKEELINKLIINFAEPVNNINLAVNMLKKADTEEKRSLYLNILEQECHKEKEILLEIEELQKILTPNNIHILQQFNLLK